MDELKACPFCGGEAKCVTYLRNKEYIYIECKDCEAQAKAFPESVHYSAEEKAIEAWNRRAES